MNEYVPKSYAVMHRRHEREIKMWLESHLDRSRGRARKKAAALSGNYVNMVVIFRI